MMQNLELKNLKIALVAEELTQLGGAERVLDCFIDIFAEAPIYTIVWDDAKTKHKYRAKDIRPSIIQNLPFGIKKYKWYLALMPSAIEAFNFDDYDLVLSVTSALIKGVKTRRPTHWAEPSSGRSRRTASGRRPIHICYCNTPTRYLWFDSEDYIKNAPIPFFARPLMPTVLSFLRKWDLKASKRPDYYIANSKNVQKRIQKYYHRQSTPIFPPVEERFFQKIPKIPGKYYLLVSRIEPYKKVDLVIEAFKKLKLPLKIVGSGTRFAEYKKNSPKNINFIGRVSDDKLAEYYQNAIAIVFPQEEDAGIVPLEAMAAGKPVIAYAKGGALESIIDKKTGILYIDQTVEGLIKAVKKFQKTKFDPRFIANHARQFSQPLFKKKILEYIIERIKSEARSTKSETNKNY